MVTSAGGGRVNADPVKHHDYDGNEDDEGHSLIKAEQERQMCRVMPMTARVSLESNHVDMRRDWVVEGNLSGGPSLADSYPAPRESNNGPNAANDLRTNHHSNLRHSAWETRLRSISSSV